MQLSNYNTKAAFLALTSLIIACAAITASLITTPTYPTPSLSALLAKGPFCPPRSATQSEQEVIFHSFAGALTSGRAREAFELHVTPEYIQHNSAISPGRDAAIAALEPMFQADVNLTIIHEIFVSLFSIHLSIVSTKNYAALKCN